MTTIGIMALFLGGYSLLMLRKVEDKRRIFYNLNAYVGAILLIIVGCCALLRSADMEEPLKQMLLMLFAMALSVIFILYGLVLVALPVFFGKQVEAKLLQYNIKLEKNYHGLFEYIVDGKRFEAESEKLKKGKRKNYEEGKNYPIWVNSKYPEMCRLNRYTECIIGVIYLIAGVALFIMSTSQM